MENEKLDQMLDDYESYMNEPIEMNCDSVLNEKYDKKEFKRGIDSMSYVSGQITALLNTGVSEEVVLAILQMEMNKTSLEKQFEVEERLATLQASAVEMKEL